MNRFEYALLAAQAPQQQTLKQLAAGFYNAIVHVEAESRDPSTDPAVVVLGSFIAFQVHADINTATGYRELLTLCERGAYYASEAQ